MNRIFVIIAVFYFFAYCHDAVAQTGFIDPASPSLIMEINDADSILFEAIFDKCDVETVKSMVADDVEFYHDKWGVTATSSEDMITSFIQGCEAQANGSNNKARREIIKSSVEIFPISNYGAMQRGKHLFYQKKNGTYEFTESGQFTHLWKKTDQGWMVARILSYDHKPTK